MNYISDEELKATILDNNEHIEDRIYALRVLRKRVYGYTPVVLSSHVEEFCKKPE